MNCTYTYKGKKYSSEGILKKIIAELPILSQEESKDWLKNYLGLSDDEVIVVEGLIDNKSLGRYMADGKILLSSLSDTSVAYHEAFHRVWRRYLSSQDRMNAIREFKQRKGYQSVIDSYKEDYPDHSDNEIIEEILADEFSDFTLNSSYKTETFLNHLFRKLYNFLQKLIGLSPSSIENIYTKILLKKYKGATESNVILKNADKVLIGGYEFTLEERNEIISILTQQFTRTMFELNGDVDLFLKSPTVKVKKLIDEYLINNFLSDLEERFPNNPDIVNAVHEDTQKWLESNKFEDSVFINGIAKNIKLLGINIKDVEDDDSSEALDDDTKLTREFISSIQLDPKDKISKKIKLLLSSLTDHGTTKNFGFPQPLSWTKGFVQIATRLAGVPTSEFMNELRNSGLPYASTLINLIEQDPIFKNKFISSLALTQNKFMIMKIEKGNIYFHDANSGTSTNKILREWNNKMIRKMEDWDAWISNVRRLNERKATSTSAEIADLLGFTVDDRIIGLKTDLNVILDKIVKKAKDKPVGNRIFEELDIRKFVQDLAEKQAKYEEQVDLMVFLGGKKLYSLSLNSQQTSIINSIKYAQSKFTEDMSLDEKIRILRRYAPFQVSEYNLTETENGYVIHNKWLQKILNGERLDIVIPYHAITDNNEQDDISNLDKTDLAAMHVNGSLHGYVPSQKHADRSTFFMYNFPTLLYPISETPNVKSTLDLLVKDIKEQIIIEAKISQNLKEPIQNIGKAYNKFIFADIISKEDFQKILSGDNNINLNPIYELVSKEFENHKQSLQRLGVLERFEDKYVALDNEMVSKYGSLDLFLAASFVNEVSSHIQESRFFSGDLRIFKNGTDLFKRLAAQSSSGSLSVTGADSNQVVFDRLNQDFSIVNPKTGEVNNVNPAQNIGVGKGDYFRSVTLAERDDYRSNLLSPATSVTGKPLISKLTGKQESQLFMTLEFNYLKDFPNMPLEKIKEIYLPKIQLYEEKYSKVNENDGQSYMTLPAFKNFMIRQGDWTDGMELVYQIEMKIASLESEDQIQDMEITFKGETFKPFEIISSGKIDGFKKRLVNDKIISLDAVHTLKTQFGGYSLSEESFNDERNRFQYLFNSIFKTSQHLLLPSAIIGTNLQLMNHSLLINGIDVAHMGSANKVGGVDPKLAANQIGEDDVRYNKHIPDLKERGLDFYDRDGYFNSEALNENVGILSYLSHWDFFKNQVAIGNKVKDEIKGSTQSLKILLSNLIVNNQERFEGAKELVEKYKETIRSSVEANKEKLLKRIGYEEGQFKTFDELKRTILESSQMQTAPENIRNSVENLFSEYENGLEVVPMKNKIENVLYSLITNGIISFDRPGSSYPQAAPTGYEKLGSRKFEEDGIQNSNKDALRFYTPVFDEDGNVIKVKPAEVIMPLPDYWIKPLLKWAKTNNLKVALDKLNADILVRPEIYQFKGLRIPNQQLSSNDMFQVKKFNLPTMQNYIITPSEIVIKVGSDYDIDSVKIYWGKDIQKELFTSDEAWEDKYESYLENAELPVSFEEFKNREDNLLGLEKQILLHPRNAHHLLMPLTDEIFVRDIYNSMVEKRFIVEPSKSFIKSLMPSTNIENTTVFVKGKMGVGIVALGITNKSTNQVDNLSVNTLFFGQRGMIPTKLLFAGMDSRYDLGAYTDDLGTIVSEIHSQLLTTQVDNVKNPTAVLMNINMQTLNTVDYLLRRGVNPQTIIYFLNQPIIVEYLNRQKINESLVNKANGRELGKKEMINKMVSDYKLDFSKEMRERLYSDVTFTVDDMEKNIKSGNIGIKQSEYFQYFLDVQEQASAFSTYQNTQTSDTKGLKDKQALDEFNLNVIKAKSSEIIRNEDFDRINREGVIAPFLIHGRNNYNIFNPLYALDSSIFGEMLLYFKNDAANIEKGDKKDKVRQTITNDFVLFLIHNFVLTNEEFNRLAKDNSVAKRIQDLKVKIPSNLVLKAFLPMLSNSKDNIDGKKIDNIRLFEKDLSALDANDLKESLQEIAEFDYELYTDIIKFVLFQSGLNVSPFNYSGIIPVGKESDRNDINQFMFIYQDLLTEAFRKMKSEVTSYSEAQNLFYMFRALFSANNPQFLRSRNFSTYPHALIKTWDKEKKDFVLTFKGTKIPQVQLGNAYHRRYFINLLNKDGYMEESSSNEEEQVQYPDKAKMKIISGGQFGGDLGGLLAARELGFETGGTAPKGYKVDSKDARSRAGSNPDLKFFGLKESESSEYPVRTMKNVDDSDGTIAFLWGSSVGTSKTIGYAQTGRWVNMIENFKYNPVKPYLVITTKDKDIAADQIRKFVEKYNINTLNIAGHRETSQPGIEDFVKHSLVQGLTGINITEKKPLLTQGSLFNRRDNQIGIEISSYQDGLGFALTNPTHASPQGYPWNRNWTEKQKEWRDYMSKGISYNGNHYKDVEEAYQKNKHLFAKGNNLFGEKTTEDLMIDLLKIKLQTYPKLVEEITLRGGSSFILNSTHQPTKQNSFWETGGENGFIRSLNTAYLSVIDAQDQKSSSVKTGIDKTLENC